MSRKILYLSKHYPAGRLVEIKADSKNHYFDNAGYNFQNSLLRGLDECAEVVIITTPPIGSFPKQYKKLFFKSSQFSHNGVSQDECAGFVNVTGIKMLDKVRALTKVIGRRLETEPDLKNIVVYSLHTPFLLTLRKIKKRYPYIKITQIVPDLPQYMGTARGCLYGKMKSLDVGLINKLTRYCDGFVLFSEPMKEILDIYEKPYIVIEGICDDTPSDYKTEKSKERSILYTGSLDKRYGVDRLVEAFRQIKDSDYRLWIRGNGTHEELVKEAVKSDSRIKYFEPMSRQDLLELQHQATVLINPMLPTDSSARYFFPSKTMDYMASGTPTIMYHLPCLPNDYLEYLYIIEDNTVDGLSRYICKILSKPGDELKDIGKRASSFVLSNKTPQKQAEKICKFCVNL